MAAKWEIHGYGHWNLSHSTTEACVIIDLPCQPGDFERKQATFIGQPTETLDAVEENVAQAALEYICIYYNIINYHVLEVTKRNLFSMQEKAHTKQ